MLVLLSFTLFSHSNFNAVFCMQDKTARAATKGFVGTSLDEPQAQRPLVYYCFFCFPRKSTAQCCWLISKHHPTKDSLPLRISYFVVFSTSSFAPKPSPGSRHMFVLPEMRRESLIAVEARQRSTANPLPTLSTHQAPARPPARPRHPPPVTHKLLSSGLANYANSRPFKRADDVCVC